MVRARSASETRSSSSEKSISGSLPECSSVPRRSLLCSSLPCSSASPRQAQATGGDHVAQHLVDPATEGVHDALPLDLIALAVQTRALATGPGSTAGTGTRGQVPCPGTG